LGIGEKISQSHNNITVYNCINAVKEGPGLTLRGSNGELTSACNVEG